MKSARPAIATRRGKTPQKDAPAGVQFANGPSLPAGGAPLGASVASGKYEYMASPLPRGSPIPALNPEPDRMGTRSTARAGRWADAAGGGPLRGIGHHPLSGRGSAAAHGRITAADVVPLETRLKARAGLIRVAAHAREMALLATMSPPEEV